MKEDNKKQHNDESEERLGLRKCEASDGSDGSELVHADTCEHKWSP